MTRYIPTKSQIMGEICALLGIPKSQPTMGSSVPRIFFSDIAAQMGLNQLGSMPAMARLIIESNHLNWSEEFSSEGTPSGGGGTVTALGLLQVKNAVLKWLGQDLEPIPNVYVFTEWEPALDWQTKKTELERINGSTVVRPGAADFRKLVLDEYKNCCSVTGCNISEVLDVAHIVPYYGIESDDIQNAIVLRTDLHRLFDNGLVSFKYETPKENLIIEVKEVAINEYGYLNGKSCMLPKNKDSRPSQSALFIKNYHVSID